MAAITSMIVGAVAVAGLGVSAAGAMQQRSAAKEQASAQREMIQQQQQQEALRQRAMELDGRRRSMEVLRNQQRARSMALATTTAQGASYGSALGGAYGQIGGQAGVQGLGISQNLDIGRQMFGSNMLESQAKMNYASAGSQMAMGQGLSSLGGTMVSNMGTIGNLAGNFGGSMSFGTGPGSFGMSGQSYYGRA